MRKSNNEPLGNGNMLTGRRSILLGGATAAAVTPFLSTTAARADSHTGSKWTTGNRIVSRCLPDGTTMHAGITAIHIPGEFYPPEGGGFEKIEGGFNDMLLTHLMGSHHTNGDPPPDSVQSTEPYPIENETLREFIMEARNEIVEKERDYLVNLQGMETFWVQINPHILYILAPFSTYILAPFANGFFTEFGKDLANWLFNLIFDRN